MCVCRLNLRWFVVPKDLYGLTKGMYRMVGGIYIPYTKFKILEYTIGWIDVDETGYMLTTSHQHSHHRGCSFPCICFGVNERGELKGGFGKNHCGWMSNVVDKFSQQRYFSHFKLFLNKTVRLEKM